MTLKEYEKYKDKRMLWLHNSDIDPKEGYINEISPSKEYIKISNKWYDMISIKILEELKLHTYKQMSDVYINPNDGTGTGNIPYAFDTTNAVGFDCDEKGNKK